MFYPCKCIAFHEINYANVTKITRQIYLKPVVHREIKLK